MLDFGALPPEVNSARMYAGAGSGPMLAAASAWDAVAGQLDLFAAGYATAISELQGESWSGGASLAMAAAAAPYVSWATTAAAQAEQTAGQARSAAGAYETAFAATVPPAVVAANRTELAILVATNFFGQNAPLIAANEAAYAAMWAADAAAMYGYAASSSAASTLTPFGEPPQTTTAAAQSAQAAAVAHAAASGTGAHPQAAFAQLISTVPQQLHPLSTTGPTDSASGLTATDTFNTLSGPSNFASAMVRTATMGGDFGTEANLLGLQVEAAETAQAPPLAGTVGAMTAGPSRDAVLASAGRAEPVGRLSVPGSWAAATGVAGPADAPLALRETAFRAVPSWAADQATSMLRGASTAGMGPLTPLLARPARRTVLQLPTRRFRMPRPAVGG